MNQALFTQRLSLAPWREDDAEAFLELTQDEGFHAYPITVYRQKDLADARAWLRASATQYTETGLGKFAIRRKSGDELIGMGGLTPWIWEGEELVDVTYRLKASAWGQGFGFEAARALVEYGFKNLNLNSITATITPDNLASKKVAVKLGLRLEKRILLKGIETELYRLLPF